MTDLAQLYSQALEAANRQDWPAALGLATQFLGLSANYGGMHYVAGVASMELGRLPHAVNHLHRATTLDPERVNFATMYARALSLARLPALRAADRASSLSTNDPGLLMNLGMVYAQEGAHAQAADHYRHALTLLPSYAPCHYFLAMSLTFLGDIDDAERELDACLRLDPTFWKAYLSRSLVRRQTPDSHHVEQLQALLSPMQEIGPDDFARTCLHAALAKEHEDLGDYPAAFTHYTLSKSASGKARHYRYRDDEAIFAALEDSFSVAPPLADGHPSSEPIFIVGMPRSGTTLLERIVSSHPDVHSAGELLNFPVTFKRASGSRTPNLLDPDTITHARHIDWRRLGADYLTSMSARTGGAQHFTDKLPHNFLYVGAIAQAFPNARIICLRRNPLDTCLSNFRQLFGEASPYHGYSYELADIGRYYILFDRLVGHWHRTLPGRILEINYEDLVDEQELVTRQLLDHCGLPWHDACLRFEQNSAPAATASAVQVRQPIHRASIDQWKKYAPQLGELRQLLADAGVNLPCRHDS